MAPVNSQISLLTLPVEILQLVAIFLATTTTTGPPSAIVPLLSTCRSLYVAVHRPQVYSSIFCSQFDTSALHRRFAPGLINALGLAEEMQRRWRSLSRIRAAAMAGEDLWTQLKRGVYSQTMVKEDLMVAYLMFLESDGRNAMHLIHWARLPAYLIRYGHYVALQAYSDPILPPDTEETALYVWLRWFCLDLRISFTERNIVPSYFIPFVFGTFAYEGFHAPWPYHHLPLPYALSLPSSPSTMPQAGQQSTVTPVGAALTVDNSLRPRPVSTALNHRYFGQPLEIAVPLASQAATLVYFGITSNMPFFAEDRPLASPADVVAAIPQTGFTSVSTVLNGDPAVFSQRPFTPSYMQTKFATITDSRMYDDQWKRHIHCWDPLQPAFVRELSVPRYRYTKGSLTGEWDARFIGPSFLIFQRIMDGEPAVNALDEIDVHHDNHSWHIQEHYFSSQLTASLPASYRLGGRPRAPPPGSPRKAHLPYNLNFETTPLWRRGRWARGLIARAPSGHEMFYQTWDPQFEDDEDDDDDESTVDIIITGTAINRLPEVPERHHCSMPPGSIMYGTIRKWDGLITLNLHSHRQVFTDSHWTLRGYLLGDGPHVNFVGRYKEGGKDVSEYVFEGAFTMVKRQTQ